jgi:very-short-patch-repair endonuclease
MQRRYIVKGQHVSGAKLETSRRLRREMTPEECLLWAKLRDGRLGARFRRQQIIAGFIVDFYCHEYGLVIEADGAHHCEESDGDRDATLRARNLRLLRITNRSIRENLPDVLAEIERAMQ